MQIDLSLSDLVAIEIMLLNANDALKAAAREADRLGLTIVAENERQRAARAERLSETLRAALTKAAEAA